MITLTDEVIVFADERVKRQRRTEAGLYGSALYALRHFKEGTRWYGALLSRAATLMRNDYRKITGDKGTPQVLREAVDEFIEEAEKFLDKTKAPTPETIANAARIIAQSIATGATNAAAEAAGKDMPDISLKTWISMEDERVRPTHAAAHGQTVPVGEKFDVGGHKMRKPGDLTAPPEEVINCRCIVALSKEEALTAATLDPNTETPGVEMAEDETREDDEQSTPTPEDDDQPERPVEQIEPPDEAMPFWGVMAPEDSESGDGRMFAESSLRTRPLPLPLATQRVNEPGHDGSVKTGNIERLWRRDGLIYYSGHFLTTAPEADELIGMMAESGGRTGVSVDADDVTMTMQTRDGRSIEEVMQQMDDDPEMEPPEDIITVFDSARVCGGTTCNIPAFHEAFIALGEVPEDLAPQDGEDLAVESLAEQMGASEEEPPEETLAAAGPVKTEDGPGWLTHPVDTDRLRDYWTRGKGAAKIGWGAPGDFNRCRAFLAEYIKPQFLNGYCANRHYDALGFWPGEHHSAETLAASAAPEGHMAAALTLVAAASRGKEPPREWFDDPELTEVTPLTITDDGRVFGHVASWDTCHIGFPESCTTAPHSMTNYAYFRTGATLCANGETVPTGSLTVGTGHADIRANAKVAMAHYDNTGACAATVAAGEDEHGIWVAGALNPFASEKQVYALRTAALSGDWRRIGGELEMVAALAVNVPGFPIPRTAMAASGGVPESLVASGVVPAREESLTRADVDAAVEAALERREAKRKMEELRVKAGLDPKSRMAALAAAQN